MGRQTNLKFVGTQANIIYYKWRGVFSMRSKPAQVQQTDATKNSAAIFGMATKLGAVLRRAFAALLPNAKDRDMQRRLEGGLRDLLRQYQYRDKQPGMSITGLQNFEFNEKAGGYGVLKKSVSVFPVGNNSLDITIQSINPVQEITAPPKTVSLNLLLAAASFDPVTGKIMDQNFTNEMIAYTDAVTEIKKATLVLQTAQNSCILMAAALQFNVNNNGFLETNKLLRWLPAMVTGVWVTE